MQNNRDHIFEDERSDPSKTGTSTFTIRNATLKSPVDVTPDVRGAVKLAQCPQCGGILKNPVTLLCGNTLCKTCIPQLRRSRNITYPNIEERLYRFDCPFCHREHAAVDSSKVNIVLRNLVNTFDEAITYYRHSAKAPKFISFPRVISQSATACSSSNSNDEKNGRFPSSSSLKNEYPGGNLCAAYALAQEGNLGFDDDIQFSPTNQNTSDISGQPDPNPFLKQHDYWSRDEEILNTFKMKIKDELDCKVCLRIFLDPLTTICGHTYCRRCLDELLQNKTGCPICRSNVFLHPDRALTDHRLNSFLVGFFGKEISERRLEAGDFLKQTFDVPLFVCTVSFPEMPTFLHVFELKYRAMISDVWASGTKVFGMVLRNTTNEPQGDMGETPFYEYGTLLKIRSLNYLPDGRSIVEATGHTRFRVKSYKVSSTGYNIGKAESVRDVGIADEEDFEVAQTRSEVPEPMHMGPQFEFGEKQGRVPPGREFSNLKSVDLSTKSTYDLAQYGIRFTRRMQERSAPWLHERIIAAYGPCPQDPATFPWWFASVLPTDETEKYKLLSTTSVRERLKICAEWVQQIESTKWGKPSSSCTVL